MAAHLSSESRRTFLTEFGGAVACAPELQAVEASADSKRVDPDLIAILNDTHIAARHPASASIPTHLREAVAWLVAQQRRPAAVIINGDLALNDGRPGDYAHFARLIAPLREAGMPVHLTLGNHDNRAAFDQVLQAEKEADPLAVSRHVGVVSLNKANLFLLDSLKTVGQGTDARAVAQGLLGPEQLSWLGRMLDEHPGKPALIFAHHNPRLGGGEQHYPGGLEDSALLWDLLASRPQVKAYIHGHVHHRSHFQHRGIHILSTPATAFVSNPTLSTTGWTLAHLTDHSAEFTTLTHDKAHAWNGMREKVAWRLG